MFATTAAAVVAADMPGAAEAAELAPPVVAVLGAVVLATGALRLAAAVQWGGSQCLHPSSHLVTPPTLESSQRLRLPRPGALQLALHAPAAAVLGAATDVLKGTALRPLACWVLPLLCLLHLLALPPPQTHHLIQNLPTWAAVLLLAVPLLLPAPAPAAPLLPLLLLAQLPLDLCRGLLLVTARAAAWWKAAHQPAVMQCWLLRLVVLAPSAGGVYRHL